MALSFSAASAMDLLDVAPALCGANGGCDAVKAGAAGQLLGQYLPSVGLFAFSSVFWGTLLPSLRLRRWVLYAALLGGFLAAALIALQWMTAQTFCGLCLGTDLAAIVVAVFAVIGLRKPATKATTWPMTAWASLFVLAVGIPPAVALSRPAPIPEYVAERMQDDTLDVIEVSDFECPYCRAMHKVVAPLLDKHRDQIRFIRLPFPLFSHLQAFNATRAYLCAEAQGKGEAMADRLFTSDIAAGALLGHALAIGLDKTAYEACMANPETGARVNALRDSLRERGVSGVPVMWIEGRRVAGFDKEAGEKPYAQALAAALAGRPVTLRPLPFIVLGVVLSILVTIGARGAARRHKE